MIHWFSCFARGRQLKGCRWVWYIGKIELTGLPHSILLSLLVSCYPPPPPHPHYYTAPSHNTFLQKKRSDFWTFGMQGSYPYCRSPTDTWKEHLDSPDLNKLQFTFEHSNGQSEKKWNRALHCKVPHCCNNVSFSTRTLRLCAPFSSLIV